MDRALPGGGFFCFAMTLPETRATDGDADEEPLPNLALFRSDAFVPYRGNDDEDEDEDKDEDEG